MREFLPPPFYGILLFGFQMVLLAGLAWSNDCKTLRYPFGNSNEIALISTTLDLPNNYRPVGSKSDFKKGVFLRQTSKREQTKMLTHSLVVETDITQCQSFFTSMKKKGNSQYVIQISKSEIQKLNFIWRHSA